MAKNIKNKRVIKKQKIPTINNIINKSRSELAKQNRKMLEGEYKKLYKKAKRIRKTFQRHGLENRLPAWIFDIKGAYKYNKQGLVTQIGNISNLLKSDMRSLKAYQERRKESKRNIEDLIDEELSWREYESMETFLEEMYIRDKDNWKHHYDAVMDLWTQARRLNLDPTQFYENYEYWLDEGVEELAKIEDAINRKDASLEAYDSLNLEGVDKLADKVRLKDKDDKRKKSKGGKRRRS